MKVEKKCEIFGCENKTGTSCNVCSKEICSNCSIELIELCDCDEECCIIKCPMCNVKTVVDNDYIKHVMLTSNTMIKKFKPCRDSRRRIYSIEDRENFIKDLFIYVEQ